MHYPADPSSSARMVRIAYPVFHMYCGRSLLPQLVIIVLSCCFAKETVFLFSFLTLTNYVNIALAIPPVHLRSRFIDRCVWGPCLSGQASQASDNLGTPNFRVWILRKIQSIHEIQLIYGGSYMCEHGTVYPLPTVLWVAKDRQNQRFWRRGRSCQHNPEPTPLLTDHVRDELKV
ncbi:hypothetical protein GGR57DRAFT_374076 [Xylariaceae sp. FL1272]|nr:hypothetical protein GGR57DRAFT_374076 [Xylariaceae sp. FL1272]